MLNLSQVSLDPNYESILSAIKLSYFNKPDKMEALHAVNQWMKTELCIQGPTYMSKEHILRQNFDGLLKCDILMDPEIVEKKKEEKYDFADDEEDG